MRVCLTNPGYTWKIPGYRADFLNFASDFAPEQLSDSGKLASFPRETREKQNGAPNTLWFPWKLPETQSAGDPLVSHWVAGNSRKGQSAAVSVSSRGSSCASPPLLAAAFGSWLAARARWRQPRRQTVASDRRVSAGRRRVRRRSGGKARRSRLHTVKSVRRRWAERGWC